MNSNFLNIKKLPLMVIFFGIAATLTSGEPWTFFGLPSARYKPALPPKASPHAHSSHLQSPHIHSSHVHSRPTQKPHIHYEGLPKPSIQDKFNFVNFFLKIKNQKRDLSCRSNPCDEGFMCVDKGLYANRTCTPIPTTPTTMSTTPTTMSTTPTTMSTTMSTTTTPPPICYQDPCAIPKQICSDNPDWSSRCGCNSCLMRTDDDVCKDATFDCIKNYVTAYNRILPFVLAHDVSEVNSICECKASCDTSVSCNTASVKPSATAGKFKCVTTGDLVQDFTLEPSIGSYTFVKESSFDMYFSKETGIVYEVVKRQGESSAIIKANCEALPNGQMIILSTKQDVIDYRAFILAAFPQFRGADPNSWFNVDLTFDAETSGLVWGDGTPLTAAYNGLLELQTDPFSASDTGFAVQFNRDSILVEARPTSWTACQIKPFQ